MDSAIHIHVSILPQIPLPFRLPHNIEQSSLCYTIGPCWFFFFFFFWFSILNIAVCTYPKLPDYPFPPSLPPAAISSFSKFVSLFLFCK